MKTLIATLGLTLAACGGGGSDLEGIYTVDTWTDNPAGCTEGPSVAATRDPLVFVKNESFIGQSFLAVVECADVGACTAEANNDEAVHLFGNFVFDHGSDDDGWKGTVSFASGPDGNNTCSGGVTQLTMTTDGAGAVSVRNETTDVPSFPASGGECTTDDAVAAAASLPCTGLETMTATFNVEF